MIPDSAVGAMAKILVEDGAYGVPWGDASDDDRADATGKARTLLEAAAPHLMTRQLSPTRWWRAIDPDGSLLAETSSTDDFTHLDLIDNPGVTFQRLYEEVPESEWREEAP